MQILIRSCLFAAAVLLSAPSTAAPYTPERDDVVLESVAPASDPAARELTGLREQLRANPQNADVATLYARRAIERGRTLGDPRYYGYADAALEPWRIANDAPVAIRVLRATLLQQRHDFAGALAELNLALAREPGHAQALLTRAVVHQVQGRLPEAQTDCAALNGRTLAAVAALCEASVISLSGRAQDALQILSRRPELGGDASLQIWAQTLRAEIHARLDQGAPAERAFRDALDTMRAAHTTDFYLLAAYADFLLDTGRPADVLSLLALFPGTDALLLRQALAAQALAGGDSAMAERARSLRAQLAERFADSRARGDDTHAREQTWFELRLGGSADSALDLASRNWTNQREPLDARLLLEASLATGQGVAARHVLDWMDQTRIEDARLQGLRTRIEALR